MKESKWFEDFQARSLALKQCSLKYYDAYSVEIILASPLTFSGEEKVFINKEACLPIILWL